MSLWNPGVCGGQRGKQAAALSGGIDTGRQVSECGRERSFNWTAFNRTWAGKTASALWQTEKLYKLNKCASLSGMPHHLSEAWGKSRCGRCLRSAQLRGPCGKGSLDLPLCPTLSPTPAHMPSQRSPWRDCTKETSLSCASWVPTRRSGLGGRWPLRGLGPPWATPVLNITRGPISTMLIPNSRLGKASTREMQLWEYLLLGRKSALAFREGLPRIWRPFRTVGGKKFQLGRRDAKSERGKKMSKNLYHFINQCCPNHLLK